MEKFSAAVLVAKCGLQQLITLYIKIMSINNFLDSNFNWAGQKISFFFSFFYQIATNLIYQIHNFFKTIFEKNGSTLLPDRFCDRNILSFPEIYFLIFTICEPLSWIYTQTQSIFSSLSRMRGFVLLCADSFLRSKNKTARHARKRWKTLCARVWISALTNPHLIRITNSK